MHSCNGAKDSFVIDDDHGQKHERCHCKNNHAAPLQHPHQSVACYLQSGTRKLHVTLS